MSTLLDVALRPAEAADQEITQSLFRSGQVLFRVHRSEDGIGRHLRVERADQPDETVVADARVDLFFVHGCGFLTDVRGLALAWTQLRGSGSGLRASGLVVGRGCTRRLPTARPDARHP